MSQNNTRYKGRFASIIDHTTHRGDDLFKVSVADVEGWVFGDDEHLELGDYEVA